MIKSQPKFRGLRRISFAGEIIGCFLFLGLGLTSDSSGLPYMIAGLCVLALSFALWLYCVRAERRAIRDEHIHENAA
jgi:hypothetical protein